MYHTKNTSTHITHSHIQLQIIAENEINKKNDSTFAHTQHIWKNEIEHNRFKQS